MKTSLLIKTKNGSEDKYCIEIIARGMKTPPVDFYSVGSSAYKCYVCSWHRDAWYCFVLVFIFTSHFCALSQIQVLQWTCPQRTLINNGVELTLTLIGADVHHEREQHNAHMRACERKSYTPTHKLGFRCSLSALMNHKNKFVITFFGFLIRQISLKENFIENPSICSSHFP